MDTSLNSILAAQIIQERLADAGAARSQRTQRRVPQRPAAWRRFGRAKRVQAAS
jgi:hypothetical protein